MWGSLGVLSPLLWKAEFMNDQPERNDQVTDAVEADDLPESSGARVRVSRDLRRWPAVLLLLALWGAKL